MDMPTAIQLANLTRLTNMMSGLPANDPGILAATLRANAMQRGRSSMPGIMGAPPGVGPQFSTRFPPPQLPMMAGQMPPIIDTRIPPPGMPGLVRFPSGPPLRPPSGFPSLSSVPHNAYAPQSRGLPSDESRVGDYLNSQRDGDLRRPNSQNDYGRSTRDGRDGRDNSRDLEVLPPRCDGQSDDSLPHNSQSRFPHDSFEKNMFGMNQPESTRSPLPPQPAFAYSSGFSLSSRPESSFSRDNRESATRPADPEAMDVTRRLEELFKAVPATVIGLDCISESNRGNGPMKYKCACCSETCLTSEDVVPHVLSSFHRRSFLQSRHADFVQRMQSRDGANIDVDRVAEAVQGQFGTGKIKRFLSLVEGNDSSRDASRGNGDTAGRATEDRFGNAVEDYQEGQSTVTRTDILKQRSLQEEAKSLMENSRLVRNGVFQPSDPPGSNGDNDRQSRREMRDGRDNLGDDPDLFSRQLHVSERRDYQNPPQQTSSSQQQEYNDQRQLGGNVSSAAVRPLRPNSRQFALHRDALELLNLEELEVRKLRAIEQEIDAARSRPFDSISYERLKNMAQDSMSKLQKIDRGKKLLQNQNSETLMALVRDLIDTLSDIDKEREFHRRNGTWNGELNERLQLREIQIKSRLEDIEGNKKRFDAVLEGKVPPEVLLLEEERMEREETNKNDRSNAMSSTSVVTSSYTMTAPVAVTSSSSQNIQPSTDGAAFRGRSRWDTACDLGSQNPERNRPSHMIEKSTTDKSSETTDSGQAHQSRRSAVDSENTEKERMTANFAGIVPYAQSSQTSSVGGGDFGGFRSDADQRSLQANVQLHIESTADNANSSSFPAIQRPVVADCDIVFVKETFNASQPSRKRSQSEDRKSRAQNSRSRLRTRSRSTSKGRDFGSKRGSRSRSGSRRRSRSGSKRRSRSPSRRAQASNSKNRRSPSPETKWGPASAERKSVPPRAKRSPSPSVSRDGKKSPFLAERRDKKRSTSPGTKWGRGEDESVIKWGKESSESPSKTKRDDAQSRPRSQWSDKSPSPGTKRWGKESAESPSKTKGNDAQSRPRSRWADRTPSTETRKWGPAKIRPLMPEVEEETPVSYPPMKRSNKYDDVDESEKRRDTLPTRAVTSSVELANSWAAQLEQGHRMKKQELQKNEDEDVKEKSKAERKKEAKLIRSRDRRMNEAITSDAFPVSTPATSLPTFPRATALSTPPKQLSSRGKVRTMTGLTGKMGGKVLRTGMVPKAVASKKASTSSDAMSSYMAEVKKFTEKSCERSGNGGSMKQAIM